MSSKKFGLMLAAGILSLAACGGQTPEAPEATSGASSDLLSNGEKTSFLFKEEGEYSIFCEPHPVMEMTVIVEEGADQSGRVPIDIANYAFSEKTVTVAPGTTIAWTNKEQLEHNVSIK